MPQSLVGTVMQYFGSPMIDRLAESFGENRDGMQKGVGAAVPALLAGLTGMVAQPGGADRLATAVQQQDPSILDNPSRTIAGTGQQTLNDKGRTLLSSLLGYNTLDNLIGSVAKYAGLGRGSASGLIGLLAPVVMAVLGKQQMSMGLDASGLGRMLTDQKSAIASAMPSGFGNPLANGDVRDAAQTFGKAAPKSPLATPTTSAGRPWAYGLGALVFLGLLGYWYWGSHGSQQIARQTNEPATSGSSQAPNAPGSMMVGQVDVGKQFSTIVDSTTKSLSTVTDAASARSALPQLNESVSQLDKVKGLADQMSPDGQKALTNVVGTAKPSLLQLIDKVQATPGVADVLKPTLDSLKAKLSGMTTAT